jgi:RNA polymerase sigma-70 factor (ECF subfamily)
MEEALKRLPDQQREALILVTAEGLSYEEAAAVCNCAVGTVKSRVSRARMRLAALLHLTAASDYGPDEQVASIVSRHQAAA